MSSSPPKTELRVGPPAWLQALPFGAVFLFFFIAPLLLIVAVSFWPTNDYALVPGFTGQNYVSIFDGCANFADPCVTLKTYVSTLRFSLATWGVSLVLGFTIAYFLAFHVRSSGMQTLLFVLCTIPFWTSNVIRMISWVPLLGRNGLINQGLKADNVIDSPVEWLLYSQFSVALAFTHLFTFFMVVPIFNSMMRIDKRLVDDMGFHQHVID